MIEDHIDDGDLVVVERRETASDGDIVVAILEDEEATLKRLPRIQRRPAATRERDGAVVQDRAAARCRPRRHQVSLMGGRIGRSARSRASGRHAVGTLCEPLLGSGWAGPPGGCRTRTDLVLNLPDASSGAPRRPPRRRQARVVPLQAESLLSAVRCSTAVRKTAQGPLRGRRRVVGVRAATGNAPSCDGTHASPATRRGGVGLGYSLSAPSHAARDGS